MENGNNNCYKISALKEAKKEADEGFFISQKAITNWLDSRGIENELPPPEADLLPHRDVNNEAQIVPVMSYAGIAQGLWGESADDSDNFIRNERES